MKNVLIVCSTGITSSLIVSKMKQLAEADNIEINVWSAGEEEAQAEVAKADVVLLSQPVAELRDTLDELSADDVSVKVIPKELYAIFNTKELLALALEE
ncbi:MAG: PTS sugar transporter subunit IIB [Erysipelothrix sp.]|nr:PTS sugar transporter subunit IIB [Erysipelothrix sp.]